MTSALGLHAEAEAVMRRMAVELAKEDIDAFDAQLTGTLFVGPLGLSALNIKQACSKLMKV